MPKKILLISPVLVAGLMFLLPPGVESQCNVTLTNSGNIPPTTKYISKFLSAPAQCTLTYQNARTCFPGYGGAATSVLFASANTVATIAPACNWVCACGPVVINGSDGLPVELMDFSVE